MQTLIFCPEYFPTSSLHLENSAVSKKNLDSSQFSNFIYTDERRLCDEFEFNADTEDDSFTHMPNYRKSEQSNKPCKFRKSLMLPCNKV